ncbi:MAG: 50S ribosomal protein L11 methyltransferase [Holophagales bacterium]|nr:50S ribosomal protein L11 methyltransferase [Holophagales bacterium]
MSYRIAIFEAPAEGEDLLVAELWRRGASGFEVEGEDPVRIEAYFPAGDLPAGFPEPHDLERWRGAGVRLLAVEELEERDWSADYRATAEPFEVGRRFVIDPRDDSAPGSRASETVSGGRIHLSVPAQNAFGTGSHESTRLALAWLEELPLTGRGVLDVGCGSGILAFAAERLGAPRVTAFDLDPPSVITARSNARRNRCSPRLLVATADALGASGRPFDLLVVNVLPERVLPHYPRLLALLRRGGSVVSSGNLTDKRSRILERFARLGLELAGEKREGEWASFHLLLNAGQEPAVAAGGPAT